MTSATVDALADLGACTVAIARELLGAHFPHEAVPLSPNEVAVLRYVQHHPGATSGEVAAATGLQRSNLSTTVRGLEAKGMVRREHGDDDARTVRLHGTDLAAASTAVVRRRYAERIGALLADTDDATVLAVRDLLARVEAGLAATR